jgi:prepilin-type N-terminal cleavage/methylation domain-containing protein
MPTSTVGKTDAGRRGVTLIEMLVVVAIMGIMIAITLPSATAGLDSVRLNTATGSVAAFLNSADNLCHRRQAPVEITIAPTEMAMFGPGVERHLKLPDGIAIAAAGGGESNSIGPENAGKILIMPGAPAPGTAIELVNHHGMRRIVKLDPMTGFPRIESVDSK